MRHPITRRALGPTVLAIALHACGASEGPSGGGLVARWVAAGNPTSFQDNQGRTEVITGEYAFTFNGGPAAGTYAEGSRTSYRLTGCTTAADTAGTWSLAGATLTLTVSTSSIEVRGCTDPALNRAAEPVDAETLRALSRALTITLVGDRLMLRGWELVFVRR